MPTNPPDYSWLSEHKGRMGSLRMIGTAVRRGRLDGREYAGHRAALVAALVELLYDATATVDEVLAVARIFVWMAGVDPSCRMVGRD
jgi:hypothetical protein